MSEEKKTNKLAFLDNLSFVKKIKQVKHIGIIIAIIFIALLLLILFNDFNFSFGSHSSDVQQTSTYYTNGYAYAELMENKLKNVLGKIKGVGNVEVMVSIEIDEYVQSVKSNNSLTDTEDKNNQQAVDVPKITGVVVVSSGASDVSVKLNLMCATQTLLNLEQSKIQIFVGN